MRKDYLLTLGVMVVAYFAANGATVESEFNFQRPLTLTPAVYPEVPADESARSSFHYAEISGVTYTTPEGVSFMVTDGMSPHKYTWRRGVDDTGTKRTENVKDGTYYLSIYPSALPEDIEADPSKQLKVTVSAPDGFVLEKVELRGQNKANTTSYLTLLDPESGTMEYDADTFTNTWTAAVENEAGSVVFTCPRKRPDGVNISSNILCGVKVTMSSADEPVPPGLELPYNHTFKSQADLDGYTVIDANGDGKTWRYASSRAQLDYPGDGVDSKDDWLITPGLSMTAGNYYAVEIHANGSMYGERMDVYFGRTPSADGMETKIMQEAVPNAYTIYRYWFCPSESGTYYLGIHGNMPKPDYSVLKIACVSVGAPTPSDAPGAPTGLKCLSAADGSRKATITFTAPSVDLAGNPLAGLDAVELYWGTYEGNCTNLIARFDDTAPGMAHSAEFTPSGSGAKTFLAVGINASGRGTQIFTNGYIGVNKPACVSELRIEETSTPGEVRLSWDAPELDVDGNPINPALIRYQLVDNVTYASVPDLTETEYTLQAVAPGEQAFVNYSILPSTSYGRAPDYTYSKWIIAGTPCAAPLREGFVGRGSIPLLTEKEKSQGTSQLLYEADLTGSTTPRSADGDKWYAGMFAYGEGCAPSVTTGKIDLASLREPSVSVKSLLMGMIGDVPAYGGNVLEIQAAEAGTENFTTLCSSTVADLESVGWHQVEASLEAFAGKVIQLRLVGRINTFHSETAPSFVFADDLAVGEASPAAGLRARTLLAPQFADPDIPFPVTAIVENIGRTDAEDVKVSLYNNGECVETLGAGALQAGASARVTFNVSLGLFDNTENIFHAEVSGELAGDDMTDNATDAVAVTLRLPAHPSPDGLQAETAPRSVTLSWNSPEIAGEAEPYTETFESGEPWVPDSFGEWTFHDLDGGPVGLPSGLALPGIDAGVSRFAWTVGASADFGSQMAYSGDRMLCSFFDDDMRPVDNWAVLPELSGEAQTVSFKVLSLSSKYPETVQVLYSEVSRDPATFVPVMSPATVPQEWTEWSFDLPEGARFFAIRQTSADGWVLLVDDVTYTPMIAGHDVSLEGYAVYRDGELLERVTDTRHADTDVIPGVHTYCVSAVYDKCESVPTRWITVDVKDVDALDTCGAATPLLEVVAGTGSVSIHNPSGCEVCVVSVSGRTVASGLTAERSVVEVPAGVYVVSGCGTSFKIVVR